MQDFHMLSLPTKNYIILEPCWKTAKSSGQ